MNPHLRKAEKALQKNIPAAEASPYRPKFHFTPPANWMNDPNGTIFHKGVYHLFYQFNPYKSKWGQLHWGHAKSTDLVHWEHLPIALAPDGFPGERHCWSGCCVIAADGTPMIFYTSMDTAALLSRGRRFSQQWVATSDADLITWEKHPQNPILSEAKHHPDLQLHHWRDPYVWKDADGWYMLLGGQQPGEKYGAVFLYQSENLLDWDYLGILAKGHEIKCKAWECPNYFKLADQYVLLVSPFQQVMYSVGEFRHHQHLGKDWFIFDHGKDFYATNTYVDDRGRTIVVGWVKAIPNGALGWPGCMSLPRQVKLLDGDQLHISPVPELERLRQRHRHTERQIDEKVEISGTAPFFGDCVEIKASYRLSDAESLGFKIADDKGEYSIKFDFASQKVDAIHESAKLQFGCDPGHLDLHIFIDKAVIEIFINDREVFTSIFYPKLHENNSLEISPFVKHGVGNFVIDFWALAPID